MARPPKPLISRSSVISASLEIIDREGLQGFSLPKLAKHLGVSAPSMYHHFADRSAILAIVVRAIVGKIPTPNREPGPDWPEYFVDLSLSLRESILRHKNAAPLVLQHMPRDLLIGSYETAANYLAASGVTSYLHVRILDGMERLSVGASLIEATRAPSTRDTIFPGVDGESQPVLQAALDENNLTSKELYAELIRSFLYGVVRNSQIPRATD